MNSLQIGFKCNCLVVRCMKFAIHSFKIGSNGDPSAKDIFSGLNHVKLRKSYDITSVKANNINDVTCSILLIVQNCFLSYQISYKTALFGIFSLGMKGLQYFDFTFNFTSHECYMIHELVELE